MRELVESLFVANLQPNYEVNKQLGADENRLIGNKTVVEKLTALQAPVLSMHGDCDPRPLSFVEEVANILPNARLIILPATFPFHGWAAEYFSGRVRAVTCLGLPCTCFPVCRCECYPS